MAPPISGGVDTADSDGTSEKSEYSPWGSMPWLRLCGFVNTMPQGRSPRQDGQVWNYETREWYFYKLETEWNDLLLQRQQVQVEPFLPERTIVPDREYYNLLNVSTDADPNELKKGFYKAARRCHPEVLPNDAEAADKFQKLAHAYQILGISETRAHYNQHGKEGEINPLGEIDPTVFFNVVFGSPLIEPYVGEVWLATTNPVVKDESDLHDQDSALLSKSERRERVRQMAQKMEEKMAWEQRKRYVSLGKNLKKRLASFHPEDPEPFVQGCRQEADKLAKGPYGGIYASTVGYALQVAAEEYLGDYTTLLGLGGTLARTRKGANNMATGFQVMGAGFRAASVVSTRSASDSVDPSQPSYSTIPEEPILEEKVAVDASVDYSSLQAFLAYTWAMNKREIQKTIPEVCRRLFDDADVSKRVDCARALQILGREFYLAGRSAMKHPSQQEYFGVEHIKSRSTRGRQPSMKLGMLKTQSRGKNHLVDSTTTFLDDLLLPQHRKASL